MHFTVREIKNRMAKFLSLTLSMCILFILLVSPAPASFASNGDELADIKAHWAETVIKEWVAQGLIKGYGNGRFGPNDSISRAEFVTLLNRIFCYTQKSSVSFPDVKKGAWYAEEIAKAYQAGIIKGDSNGSIKPEAVISRQEAAVILTRAFSLTEEYTGDVLTYTGSGASLNGTNSGASPLNVTAVAAPTGTNSGASLNSTGFGISSVNESSGTSPANENISAALKYADHKQIADWAIDSVGTMTKKGYISGRPGNLFAPKDDLSRSEAVKMIDNVMGELINSSGTYTKTVPGNMVVSSKDVTLKDTNIDGDLYLTDGIGQDTIRLIGVTVKGRTIISGTLSGKVIVLSGDFEEIVIESPGAIVTVESGTVDRFVVGKTEAGAVITAKDGTVIEDLITYAGADITGGGNIKNAVIASGGVTMDEKPQNVIIADGGKAVSYKPGPGNTVVPGGGGSGGGPGSGDPGSGGSGGGGDSGGGDDDDDDPGDGDDDDPKPDTIAPSIPTGLTGIAVSSSAVSLSWTASTDNVGVAGYCVYRKAMSEDEFTLISKPNGTSYTDNAVNKNITYEYMVSAVDTAKNESENSQAISIWCQAGCKTVWAASCAYPDVSAAVHTAQANDTVMVPAGEAIWTQMLTLNKPVRLIGAGMDRTTIVNGIESTRLDNFLLYLHPDNPQDDPIMEIAGFTINADNNGGCIRIENSSTTHAWKNFRVHHNKIMNNDGSTDAYMAVRVKGLSFGLIDHNIFENNCYDFKVYGRMAYSWNLFPGVDNIGTENYLYIENNISRNVSKVTLASGEGARWVYRYNTIEGKLALDAHGDTRNRGVVAHEIYENVATNDFSPVTGGGFSHDYRGGTGIIFNNKAQIGTSGTRGKIQVREEQESCSCPQGCDESPGGDQVNNGYIWNNINTRDNKIIAIWESDAFNHIEEDRDWWDDAEHSPGGESPSNFTYGLHADRPQASVDHDCYWESDTRKLYRSIGDNNWTFVYEPYQYPHPFSVQFPITQQNGDSESPSVPTNLTATVVFSDTIDLSWSASTDDVGVTGYRIYRKTVNEDEYTLIAEPDTTTFSDQNVTGNCIYEYAITAVDAAGNESDKHFSVCIWCRPGAKTIWAASCSHSDIKTAIDTAEQGDTVLVPAGTSVWSDSITITKGIQLLGAGIDKTVIQYDGPSGIGTYAVTVSPDLETAQNDYPVRITGFTFEKLVPVYGTLLLENKHLEHPLTKVMIDHNKFINLVTASRQFSIELRHAMFGVVHNNVLQDGSGAWRFLGGLADGKEVECWAPGSLNAMYFEDNYLYTTADSSSPLAISGGNGNRYVSRYNTFDLSSKGPSAFAQTHDIHGNQPNNSGAGIGFETYGNHRIGTAGRWLDQRAGKVYFFYNRWSKSNGKGSYTVWEEYNDDAFSPHSGEGTAYPRTVAGNLIQHPYGSYYWRNFGGMEGNILSTECNILFDHYNRDYDSNPAVVNDPLILFENQNWWRDNIQPFDGTIDPVGTCGYYKGEPCTKSGIGYGTLEDMNAITPTAEGLGFWVTDQEFDLEKMTGQNPEIPIEGTLYRAVADGLGGFKWEKHYTPLVYPHPLRTLDRIDVP